MSECVSVYVSVVCVWGGWVIASGRCHNPASACSLISFVLRTMDLLCWIMKHNKLAPKPSSPPLPLLYTSSTPQPTFYPLYPLLYLSSTSPLLLLQLSSTLSSISSLLSLSSPLPLLQLSSTLSSISSLLYPLL